MKKRLFLLTLILVTSTIKSGRKYWCGNNLIGCSFNNTNLGKSVKGSSSTKSLVVINQKPTYQPRSTAEAIRMREAALKEKNEQKKELPNLLCSREFPALSAVATTIKKK